MAKSSSKNWQLFHRWRIVESNGAWSRNTRDFKVGDCNYCLACNDVTPFILAGLWKVLGERVTLSSGERNLHDHLNKGHDDFLYLLSQIVSLHTKTKLYPWLPTNQTTKDFGELEVKFSTFLNSWLYGNDWSVPRLDLFTSGKHVQTSLG